MFYETTVTVQIQVSRTILANVDVFQVSKLLFLKLNAQYNFKGIAKISPTATVDANVHIFHKSLTNVGETGD